MQNYGAILKEAEKVDALLLTTTDEIEYRSLEVMRDSLQWVLGVYEQSPTAALLEV